MNKRSSSISNTDNQSLRVLFKQGLGKLSQISTREQAFKQLKTLILQNKTTSNLRIWLSVLNQNRNKHNQSQINIIGFIVQKYGTGLLDPLDKLPSIQKTTFRITQLLLKFFADSQPNVQYSCQKAWIQIYLSVLFKEDIQLKKKLIYNNLEALINGGGGKVSQTTAQLVIQGLLETSLNKQDHQFFKQIAKRTLVLFLKTTVIHHSTLTCLQSILSFFGINNLIPLLENICSKIISYISLATPNSSGYKIKSECCNALGLIGDQIDKNGLIIYPKIIKVLEDLATDKVWAVQAPGRKALTTWKNKKNQWQNQFLQKQQRFDQQFYEEEPQNLRNQNRFKSKPNTVQDFYQPNKFNQQNPNNYRRGSKLNQQQKRSHSKSPARTYENNWIPRENKQFQSSHQNKSNTKIPLVLESGPISNPYQQYNIKRPKIENQIKEHSYMIQNLNPKITQQVYKTYNQGFYNPNSQNNKFLHKNTGIGGGNNVQTVEQFYQKPKNQETYAKKMDQIKRSIYNQNKTVLENIEYDETIPWQQAKSLPDFNKNSQKFIPSAAMQKQNIINNKNQNNIAQELDTRNADLQFVQKWQQIVDIYEKGDPQKSVKMLLEMDDDIYFLRFLLQYGQNLMRNLTRPTSSKLLKKLLLIQKTNFMQQMLFKMVSQTAKIKAGQLLKNSENLQIIRNLQKCQKINGLQNVSKKLIQVYQNSLN